MLILASQSPRRRELLRHLGVEFKLAAADIDESIHADENAKNYVCRLAIEKAQVIAQQNKDLWVLGADTTVAIDGHIMGKPSDLAEAKSMLLSLSGRCHQVYTAIALVKNENFVVDVVTTDVVMTSISPKDIDDYWASGEPQDKAGSYGIQGIGGKFVTEIHGSYSNVVGLPLVETAKLLKQVQILT